MSSLVKQLTALDGYSYSLWEYQKSHSVLTIRATHPDKPMHNVHFAFSNVYYVQMPLVWRGDFELGSMSEFVEIAKRAGMKGAPEGSYEVLKQGPWSLFKAKSPYSVIYLLGHLTAVEYDVEPVY